MFSSETVAAAGGSYSFGDAEAPAVVVCTPVHLSSLVRGPVILDEGLFQHLRHLVLDEVSSTLCA